MSKLFISVLLLSAASGSAQSLDTIKVLNLPFVVEAPAKWQQMTLDTGLCLYETTNISYSMPVSTPTCFGTLILSVSEITDKEREERKNKDSLEQTTEDVIYERVTTSTYYKYPVVAGWYETTAPKIEEPVYTESSGFKRKKKKKSEEIRIRNYTRWVYFPINDTLEILIAFRGRIPESEAQYVDGRVNDFADYFFQQNDTLIDSLLAITDPYRTEPATLPLDSIYFLNTYMKYPVLPGWSYDTTRTSSEIKTTLLKVKSNDPEICDQGSITISYRITPLGDKPKAEDLQKISLYDVIAQYQPQKQMSDSARAKARDSSFAAYEHHYYFTQTNDVEDNPSCVQFPERRHTLYITIYTKTNERIKINVTMVYAADKYVKERNYLHAFDRFIYFMVTKTNYEEFYLNNKD